MARYSAGECGVAGSSLEGTKGDRMYRLLIADDEGIMLESFTEIIRKQFGERITVSTAKSGRSAIEQAESFHPDIVFMDIRMPGINGIQAIR